MSAAFIECLERQLEMALLMPSQDLMQAGDYGDEMYVLQSGDVSVKIKSQVIAEVQQGAVMGEMAVMGDDRQRYATCTSDSICILQVLRGNVFRHVVAKFPREKQRFDALILKRMVLRDLPKIQQDLKQQTVFFGMEAGQIDWSAVESRARVLSDFDGGTDVFGNQRVDGAEVDRYGLPEAKPFSPLEHALIRHHGTKPKPAPQRDRFARLKNLRKQMVTLHAQNAATVRLASEEPASSGKAGKLTLQVAPQAPLRGSVILDGGGSH